MNKILKAFLPIIAVLIIHAVIILSGTYYSHPLIDIPMHFLGGFAVASMFVSLLKIAEDKKILKINKPLRFLFVISFVVLIAVGWEFFEYLLEASLNFKSQLSIADTMGDLLFGLLGAIASYCIKR